MRSLKLCGACGHGEFSRNPYAPPRRGETRDEQWHFRWVHHVKKAVSGGLLLGAWIAQSKQVLSSPYCSDPCTPSHFSLLFWEGQGDFLQHHTAIPWCKEDVLQLPSSSALSQMRCVQITLRCWRSTGMHKRCNSRRRARCCSL